jgi:hypothetical protein
VVSKHDRGDHQPRKSMEGGRPPSEEQWERCGDRISMGVEGYALSTCASLVKNLVSRTLPTVRDFNIMVHDRL